MSIEITLFCKKSTKKNLADILRANGFSRCKHILDELNTPEHLHYTWFEFEDSKSFTGVEAAILKATDEERTKFNCSQWILHTRTRAAASRQDLEKQNYLVKQARKALGGSFYNDWYGTNKYIDTSKYPELNTAERSLFLLLENTNEKLGKLRLAVDDYQNSFSKQFEDLPNSNFKQIMSAALDPGIILFNSLLSFCVSIIEYFFSETFEILLKANSKAQNSLKEESIKIPLRDAIKIRDKELTIENIISREYSFQNLDHIHKAYKKYLDIDIANLLSMKKRVGGKIVRLSTELKNIIERRHKMIHNFDFDVTFKKKEFIDSLQVVLKTTEIVIDSIETRFKWIIRVYG